MSKNLHKSTIKSFGEEWKYFDQTALSSEELERNFQQYFSIFPWETIDENSQGFDMGCGSGRWAQLVAPKVGKLHCIDPSEAIQVAKKNLSKFNNIYFHKASVDSEILQPESQDFGYSIGVLHHVPDTKSAIRSCARLLKPGGVLLLYMYYAFENRPWWFKSLWKLTDLSRRLICILPSRIKRVITDLIAIFVYFPLSRVALNLEKLGFSVEDFPLYFYRNRGLYTLRTDALDRFGTPLEHRFTSSEITKMLEEAGLKDIKFSEDPPYWCVVGYRN